MGNAAEIAEGGSERNGLARGAAAVGLLGAGLLLTTFATFTSLRSTNESRGRARAVGTLRSIATAEEQFLQGNIVDQDADGRGEYGWLGELAGVDACRTSGLKMRTSPYIAAILGVKDGGGRSQKSGYYFHLYLQDEAGDWNSEPLVGVWRDSDGEIGDPFAESVGAADYNEKRWICYAWPNAHGVSGDETFVVNETREVWRAIYDGDGPAGREPYSGTEREPEAMAAFIADGSRIADGRRGERGQDGRLWAPVRY